MSDVVEWHGIETLEGVLGNAGKNTTVLATKVVQNNAEKGKNIAKKLAPVDTGILKSRIKTEYSGLTAKIHDSAPYAGYQEYGTRYQDGKPHIRPMLKEIEPIFKKDLTDIMRGAFK